MLVHDLGPNWELVSDAINSTLQLKVKRNLVYFFALASAQYCIWVPKYI